MLDDSRSQALGLDFASVECILVRVYWICSYSSKSFLKSHTVLFVDFLAHTTKDVAVEYKRCISYFNIFQKATLKGSLTPKLNMHASPIIQDLPM